MADFRTYHPGIWILSLFCFAFATLAIVQYNSPASRYERGEDKRIQRIDKEKEALRRHQELERQRRHELEKQRRQHAAEATRRREEAERMRQERQEAERLRKEREEAERIARFPNSCPPKFAYFNGICREVICKSNNSFNALFAKHEKDLAGKNHSCGSNMIEDQYGRVVEGTGNAVLRWGQSRTNLIANRACPPRRPQLGYTSSCEG